MNPRLVEKALQLFIDGVHEKDPLKRTLLSRRMHEIMYGFYDDKNPFSHLLYNHQRHDLFHNYSAKTVGHTFGLREYSKFLSLKDYLEMPIDIVDDILEGYGRGTEEALKAKAEAARREAEKHRGARDPAQQAIDSQRGHK